MTGKPLLDVLKSRKATRRPIWFMRQAGRYLPEYREVRAKAGSFLDLCYNPELAAEVTLQPLRRFDLDAAILFADILNVPHAMGLGLRFEQGEGPRLETVRDMHRVERLRRVAETPEVLTICDTVRRVREGLPSGVALIGFCGAPWTVATYMIEGQGSDRRHAKLAAFENQPWFVALIGRLVAESIDYLCRQIEAGAEAVQIFDSWAGDLPPGVREKYVMCPLSDIIAGVRARHPSVPVIAFARGIGVDHVKLAGMSGAEAVGVETEMPLGWLADELKSGCAVQGNLDPIVLLAPDKVIAAAVERVVSSVPMERHIFNLGHGIRQETPPDAVIAAICAVRDHDSGKNK